jgi:predicted dienelactone hydrolase
MTKKYLVALGISLGLLAGRAHAACDRGVDMPELSHRGDRHVGVRAQTISAGSRLELTQAGLAGGRPAAKERRLSVTFWYPTASVESPVTYRSDARAAGVSAPRGRGVVEVQGCAARNAPALKARAPLVVFSHGYGGWATYTADLAETLASRGYVVAAIDHDDLPAADAAGFAVSFLATAVNRAQDQQAVIAALRQLSADPGFPLAGAYDPENLGLIGYSMGGFGALATAGAGYDPESPMYHRIPGDLLSANREGVREAVAGLRALVLISPWGAQQGVRSWSPNALDRIRTPTLLMVGDQDDVVGYDDGVRWIFQHLTGADRRLLVFENARHNIIGAAAPSSSHGDFAAIERFEEPVWRKDRLQAINAHFIVAFLDLTLRGRAASAAYLDPGAVRSNEGVWSGPPPGPSSAGAFAGLAQAGGGYWRGFQRRWALGLRLEHQPVGR